MRHEHNTSTNGLPEEFLVKDDWLHDPLVMVSA